MNSPTRLRCLHCRQPFVPNYRNAYRQRYCSTPDCQYASKRASQHRWLRKPANRKYFREPDNLKRVRDWRVLHPGYWRAVKHRCSRVRDPERGHDPSNGLPAPTGTLQDFCRSKTTVLAGLISRLSRCALQEDMASCASQMVNEAQCILIRCQVRIPPPGQGDSPANYYESG